MDASPTKVFLMENREHFSDYHEYAFGKRPAYELYDLEKDPDQIVNVASHPDYTMVRDELLERMMKELRETGDPRVIGDGATFDQKPYVDPEYVPPQRRKYFFLISVVKVRQMNLRLLCISLITCTLGN